LTVPFKWVTLRRPWRPDGGISEVPVPAAGAEECAEDRVEDVRTDESEGREEGVVRVMSKGKI